MKYDDPELRERLAGQYVLGTLPSRARRRFERLLAEDATLAAAAAAWIERFMPLDDATPAETPPAHVWSAIARRTGLAEPASTPVRPPVRALAFWRSFALAAACTCAALVLYLVVASPLPGVPRVFAVLADAGGQPAWIALAPPGGEVNISAIGAINADPGHSFQLWAIAGGKPQSLGLLQPRSKEPLTVTAAALPGVGGALAVSLEPPGGSPTGQPTGPVLFQGKILPPPGQ